MTPNDARKAIYARFLADFSDPILVRDRILFDNEMSPDDPTIFVEWVRLVVRHQTREQITLGKEGGRKFQSSGVVLAQIFTKVFERTSRADSIAKSISDIFDAVDFEGLNFQAAASRESGPDGKWNVMIVEAPFTYQETK